MRPYQPVIIATDIPADSSLSAFIMHRWRSAFARLSSWIRTSTIHLTDVNGSRGGVCKRCRIVMHTTVGRPIVIDETRDRVPAAVVSAIGRVAHTLKRKAAKKRRQKRRATRTRSGEGPSEADEV